METVNSILDVLSYILGFACVFAVYKAIAVFIPTRKHWLIKVLAFLLLRYPAMVIIYLDDPWNISLALVGFVVYIVVFYSAKWEKKVTAFLIFNPTIISKERTEGGLNKRTIFMSSYLTHLWFFRIASGMGIQ